MLCLLPYQLQSDCMRTDELKALQAAYGLIENVVTHFAHLQHLYKAQR